MYLHVVKTVNVIFVYCSKIVNIMLGQTYFMFRLSRIPTVFCQEMEKNIFLYCRPYENCAES